MKTTPVIKPLLMASASAVLGLAIVGVLGNAPANAAGFRVYGKFAPEAAINPNNTVEFLGNASFEGTLDIDETYVNTPVIRGWRVQLLDSQGYDLFLFDSRDGTESNRSFSRGNFVTTEIIDDRSSISIVSFLSFYEGSDTFFQVATLNLFLDQPNLTGNILSNSNTDLLTVSNFSNLPSFYYKINVVDGYVEKVPEPSTIVGLSLASIMGWWMKRRKKALQEV